MSPTGFKLVILNKTEFRDGTIEIELTGEPSPTAKSTAPRGFVGMAFRVNLDAAKDVAKYECSYLRPTNGRADDQVRRNRLRHQRNKTTVGRIVPSYLLRNYNGGLLGDCSKLLRFRNIDVHTP
jgi:hypothetical protein